jgi:hypothetical protein
LQIFLIRSRNRMLRGMRAGCVDLNKIAALLPA